MLLDQRWFRQNRIRQAPTTTVVAHGVVRRAYAYIVLVYSINVCCWVGYGASSPSAGKPVKQYVGAALAAARGIQLRQMYQFFFVNHVFVTWPTIAFATWPIILFCDMVNHYICTHCQPLYRWIPFFPVFFYVIRTNTYDRPLLLFSKSVFWRWYCCREL